MKTNLILMKTPNPTRLLLLSTLLFTGLFFFYSCIKSSSRTGTGSSAMGHLEIRLTDGPATYDAVYIDIQQVEVNASTDSTDSGWRSIPLLRPGIYNLLDFKNGIDTVLASADLPAGKLSQLRLILGDGNSVVIGGKSYPMKTPSAQQSGLKLNINATLTGGILYRLYIDFDAARSIVATGNGKYNLKPVIRTYADAIGGSIKGFVLPAAAKPEVWAVQGTDTLMALPDTATGYYFFGGVTAGPWNLLFHAQDTTYADTTSAVTVITGVVTDAGTVTLRKK